MTDKLTPEDMAGMAQLEHAMDEGTQTYVRCTRQRKWAFPAEMLEEIGIVSGQQVSDALLLYLLEQNVAYIQTKIALQTASAPTNR